MSNLWKCLRSLRKLKTDFFLGNVTKYKAQKKGQPLQDMYKD